jgi:hypothetical protein
MSKNNSNAFAFERINYIIMLVGVGIIALGFTIMALDGEVHGFGVMGLTIGPVITVLGFLVEFAAIFYKAPQKKQ